MSLRHETFYVCPASRSILTLLPCDGLFSIALSVQYVPEVGLGLHVYFNDVTFGMTNFSVPTSRFILKIPAAQLKKFKKVGTVPGFPPLPRVFSTIQSVLTRMNVPPFYWIIQGVLPSNINVLNDRILLSVMFFITARKRSCGKVMFLHLCIILFTAGLASQHASQVTWPGGSASRGSLHPGVLYPRGSAYHGGMSRPPARSELEAGGAHPTGMLCFLL